jgi:DNA-binding transcriptional LysR family regulator
MLRQHIGDGLAAHFVAQCVGCRTHRGKLVIARLKQANDVAFRQPARGGGAIENARELAMRDRRSAEVLCIRRQRSIHTWRPVILPRPAVGVDALQKRLAQAAIDPILAGAGIAWIDRQPINQPLAGALRRALQHAQMRPRRLRIHMIRRDRRHPAPVIDAGGDQLVQRAGIQIGWRLDVHVGGENQARRRDRP